MTRIYLDDITMRKEYARLKPPSTFSVRKDGIPLSFAGEFRLRQGRAGDGRRESPDESLLDVF